MFVTRVRLEAGLGPDWPFTLAPVAALHEHGLEFQAPVTFLVGENGSGKSTIVEAIADICKIGSYGGKAGTRYASTGAKTPLGEVLTADMTVASLRLTTGPRSKRHGFFLRAETLFDLAGNVSGRPGFWEQDLEQQSHGEGFTWRPPKGLGAVCGPMLRSLPNIIVDTNCCRAARVRLRRLTRRAATSPVQAGAAIRHRPDHRALAAAPLTATGRRRCRWSALPSATWLGRSSMRWATRPRRRAPARGSSRTSVMMPAAGARGSSSQSPAAG